MGKTLERTLWLVVLSLALNVFVLGVQAQTFVSTSNVELRGTSFSNSDWSGFQKAKPGDQIMLRATLFAEFIGEGYQGQSTLVSAYADIFGCNGSSCSYLSRTAEQQEWVIPNQPPQPTQWDGYVLTATNDYDSYEFRVHARTSDTDYSQNDYRQNPTLSRTTLTVVKDKSYCAQLEFTTHSLTLNESTSYNDYFTIRNSSDEDFVVDSININSNDSFMSFVRGSTPNRLYAGQTANVYFTANAGSVDSSKYGNGTAWLSGRFANSGVQCSLSATDRQEQKFTFYVRDTSSAGAGKCSQIISSPYTLYIDEGLTQTFGISVKNDSNEDLSNVVAGVVDDGAFFDTAIDSSTIFSRLRRGETKSVGLSVSAGNVSYTQSGTAYIRIEGDFLDSSEACRGDKIEIPVSVVVRNTSASSDCNHVSISADSVQLNENSAKTISLGISNSDDRGFYLEDLQVYDYSSVFDSRAIDMPSLVSGKGSAAFNAKIESFGVSSDITGTAYAKLKGHFSDGQKCDYFDVQEKSFAVTVRNAGDSSVACRQITLQAYPMVAKANSVATQNFYVQNNSGQTFYIDNANVYDSDKYFDAQAESFDSFALAGSNAIVRARVLASSPSGTLNSVGYFQVRGHFYDNTYCSYSDIGTTSFPARVEETSPAPLCQNFVLSVPQELAVNGKTQLSFSYSNPLPNDATLALSAPNAAMEKASFVLPANSGKTLSTYVEMSGSGTSLLEYAVSAPNCSVPSKFTTLRAGQASLAGQVELERYPYPIVLQGSEFDVQVTISSNSGSNASVVLGLEQTPSDWQTQSVTVALQPYERERTVQLHVKASNLNYSGSVRLTMQSQSETFSRIIEVQPKGGAQAGVALTASVSEAKDQNGLTVSATVTNNSGSAASGTIALSLPTGWTWSGDNSVSLEPGQQKQVSLAVKPAGSVSGNEEMGVKFVPSSGTAQQTETTVKAKPSVPLLPSALVGLGANELAFIVGVVVVVAVIAFGLFRFGHNLPGKKPSGKRGKR